MIHLRPWESSDRRAPLNIICTVFLITIEDIPRIWWRPHANKCIFIECWNNEHLGRVILAARRHACQQWL